MSGRSSRSAGMFLVLGLAGMAMLFLAVLASEVNGPEEFLVGVLALGGFGWLLLRGPVGKALASMLEGGGPQAADPALAMRVADLEDRVQELTLEAQRLMEIEERIDFTERLIASREDAVRRGGDDGR
ncbi:MAG: hypothetical protein SFU84_11755 [Gemmatimonadales bacterium]|nr:hypothetical protein [Gemmatimonadales bacterium]